MKLSIVATLYQSAPYISEFHERATATAKQLVGNDYEIVFVNDGSPDNSLDLAVRLSELDYHVVVVELSRNFGHHKAMMTGLAHARGDKIFLIDSDLEEEPEWLITFDEQLNRNLCDVVYGVQEHRRGGWFEYWSGKFFYLMFNNLSGLSLPQNIVTARLMKSYYVQSLLLHQERELVIAGLWHITGFDQQLQIVNKHRKSHTTYTLRKKMALFVNSVTSFSNAPLIWIFYIGISISLISLLYTINLILNWIYWEKPLIGWTSVMASIWLLGGLVISFVGVLGIYLSKIFIETKKRPYTIVRNIYKQLKDHKKIQNNAI